jgi:hypothetical protein
MPAAGAEPKAKKDAKDAKEVRERAAGVEVVTDGECGGVVGAVEWVRPDAHLRVTLKDGLPNHWFLLSLRGVKGRKLVIEVVGGKTVHGGFPWKGVRPVVASAAGDGLSDPALYSDARSQSALRDADKAEYDEKTRTMRIEHAFPADGPDSATVSLRAACPPSYVEARAKQMEKDRRAGAYSAGNTPGGRPLRYFTVPRRDGTGWEARWKARPTLLLYGGEHATEHDSSQAPMGALEWLLSDDRAAADFRGRFNVVLIPHLFPDDTAGSVFDRFTDGFMGPDLYPSGPENVAWAELINGFFDAGFRIHVAACLHNTAGAESPNLYSPSLQVSTVEGRPYSVTLTKAVLKRAADSGFAVSDKLGRDTQACTRLYGWCEDSFSTAAAIFEVNGRHPGKTLPLFQLRALGATVLRGLGDLAGDPCWGELGKKMTARLARREARRKDIVSLAPFALAKGGERYHVYVFNLMW